MQEEKTSEDKNKLPELPPEAEDGDKEESPLEKLEKALENNLELTETSVGIKISV